MLREPAHDADTEPPNGAHSVARSVVAGGPAVAGLQPHGYQTTKILEKMDTAIQGEEQQQHSHTALLPNRPCEKFRYSVVSVVEPYAKPAESPELEQFRCS